MTRVLFLTPHLPYPPNRGTALRNFGLIEGLAAHGHTIGLASFVEPGQPPLADTPLPDLCETALAVPAPTRTTGQRLRELLAGHADMARRLWSAEFAGALRGMLGREPYDVVQIEGIEMAPYLPIVQEAAPGALLIYDAHNAEYALQARIAAQDSRTPRRWPYAIYSLLQTTRLRRFEAATCHAVGHILACSQADADKLRLLGHETPISVIPNAIEVARYQEADLPSADLPHPALVFTGKMDFRPNVDAALWFAEAILPPIQEAIPEAHFVIVGMHPHPRLDPLRERRGITITGEVPDIRPYIREADLYITPLRMGSGTRFKLLEAMAMGKAIVSTRIGAEGLPVEDGQHLLLADEPEPFAEAVVGLLRDAPRAKALGEQGAMLVSKHFDWPGIIPRVEVIYRQAPTG
jgi:glycosyltransferase involved in cell wall biosynthesis